MKLPQLLVTVQQEITEKLAKIMDLLLAQQGTAPVLAQPASAVQTASSQRVS